MSLVKTIAIVLVVLTGCLALQGCSGKPCCQGEVQPGTGGRGNNSMYVYGGENIQLYYGDDTVTSPSRQVDMAHSGSRVTVAPLTGALPAWLQLSAITTNDRYFSHVTLTFVPQRDVPHTERVTLRFTASDADGSNVVYQDVPITATRVHSLSPQREFRTHTVGSPGNLTTRLELAAEGRWTASASQPWVRLPSTSGQGNASIDVAIDAGTLTPGEHFAFVNYYDIVSQRYKGYTLLLIVDARRLETDERGLAFSATPGASRLTRELHITDTSDFNGLWRISDDAAWLTASTNTGAGDAVVTLNADPTGLAEGLHFATVTVSPDNEPGLTNSSVVRVAFHVDRSTPANTSVALEGSAPAGALAADTLRPWLYGFDRNGADSTLRVWNFHSGALLQTLTVPNLAAARARVAPDGRMLLVSDSENRKFVAFPVDTEVRAPLAPWTAMRFAGRFEDFAFARINGAEVIVWSAAQLLSPENGAVLYGFEPFSMTYAPTIAPALAVANDGRFGCMVNSAGGRSNFLFFVFGHRAGTFSSAIIASGQPVGASANDCLTDSRSRNNYVVVDGAVRRFPFFQLESDRQRPASADELQSLSNGELYLSGGDATWKHLDGTLAELATRSVTGERVQGVISADETRLFELVSAGAQRTGTFRNRDF